ncbi:MAG: hypothetical protein ABWX56_02015 [Mycetocola sp.]
MDRAGFDPRYSPEFQRGFDRAAAEQAQEEFSAETGAPERVLPVPPPAVRRIPPVPTATPAPPDADATLAELGFEEPTDAEASELPASPWRNPYLVALTVTGLALVAGGIGAFRWAVSQVYGGTVFESGATEDEMREAMLASQLAWGLSPLLTLAGVLTLLGVLFFVAHRWRPRRGLTDDEDASVPTGV